MARDVLLAAHDHATEDNTGMTWEDSSRDLSRHAHAPSATVDTSAVAVAGGGTDVAEAAEDVVQPEGPAAPGKRAESAISVWLFQPEAVPRAVSLHDLPELVSHDENFVWIDVGSYATDDLRTLAGLLGLPRRAVRTAVSPWHRPRLDVHGSQFFVSTTIVRLEPERYQVFAAELDLFMGNNFLVSAHKHALPFAQTCLTRARSSPQLVHLDSAFMLYIMLDELLAHYEDLVEHVQAEIESTQLHALRQTSDTFLESLVLLKRYVFALNHLAMQHRDVFVAFLRPDFPFISDDDVVEYFEDLDSRLARLLDMLVVAGNGVTDAFDIYVSHMSQQTNQVIKLLTMVSTVLLPATVIVSIFGTNIAASIRTVPLDTPIGLLVMFMCILAVTGATLLTFHRRGWI